MKLQSSTNMAISLSLIALLVFMPQTCSGAKIWADDFDDGNYDDWIVVIGNFTAENGMLQANGQETNGILHESNIAFGTWRFDIYAVHSSIIVSFITGDSDAPDGPYRYFLKINPEPAPLEYNDDIFTGYALCKAGLDAGVMDTYETDLGIIGQHHIDIMRNTTGGIRVHIDGVLRLSAGSLSYRDQSENFTLGCPIGCAIDNVFVYDTEESPFPPPASPLGWFVIGGGSVVLVILVVIVLKRR